MYALQYDSVGRQPIVLLRTSDERLLLPIWIVVIAGCAAAGGDHLRVRHAARRICKRLAGCLR